MIMGIWQNIKLYCPNHDDPIEFVPREGVTTFYGCPKYFRRDEKHPGGWDEFERACPNRLNFDDAQDIVVKLSDILEESFVSGEITDFTNLVFKHKYYTVKVLKYSLKDMSIDLGVTNNRAMPVTK